jgi:hypothetical protein
MALQVHQLRSAPAPELQARLEDFERQFDYPLGPDRRFRISHGDDYTRFFNAMGEAVCLVAENSHGVVGTLAVVARRLLTPEGRIEDVTYLADLKIATVARGGRALLQLARAALAVSTTSIGYCVVMDGTRVVPDAYTNRLGIPGFHAVENIDVLRIPADAANAPSHAQVRPVTAEESDELFVRGSRGSYAALAKDPAQQTQRARFKPQGLALSGGGASGLLEDTLQAKRLLITNGGELESAHLSQFVFTEVEAGAKLIQAALTLTRDRGLPALFAAIPSRRTQPLLAALQIPHLTRAPATIFGAGLMPGHSWNLNTSEI